MWPFETKMVASQQNFIDLEAYSCLKQSLMVFRWFEVGHVIWAQVSQIGVSQIKAPIGSLFQKYVYSSFMVKMRIDLGSFGLFWFILGWG